MSRAWMVFLSIVGVVAVAGGITYYALNREPTTNPGPQATTADCFSCHGDLKPQTGYTLHPPAGSSAYCSVCHNVTFPNGPSGQHQAELTKTSVKGLCTTCHDDEAVTVTVGTGIVHAPYQMGMCTTCHDPHQSPQPSLLKAPLDQVCSSCHSQAMQETAAQPVQHAPFAAGQCTSCHQPHTAANQYLLTAVVPDLCLSCHGEVKEQQNLSVQHAPFEGGQCLSCHVSPHAAPEANLLASGSRKDLCGSCHDNTVAAFTLASTHPVGQSGFDCNSCHTSAHASNNSKLLAASGDTLCASCHVGTASIIKTSAHKNIGTTACTKCHLPHGSADKPLLAAPQQTLCQSCHADKKHQYVDASGITRYSHPLGTPYYNPRNGGVMTCSSCHLPHGSVNDYMLFDSYNNAFCLTCHPKDLLQQ